MLGAVEVATALHLLNVPIRMPFSPLPVNAISATAYMVPTDRPESDGTLAWESTTMVAVHVDSDRHQGFGYTYADRSAQAVVEGVLQNVVQGRDAHDVTALYDAMRAAVRNNGEGGLSALAVAAVDMALWDLKAKALEVPLYDLLGGRVRDAVELYGSGGFTSYTGPELREQLGGWADQGFRAVKMKIGRDAQADPDRIASARRAIGPHTQLFTDANAAYTVRDAVAMSARMRQFDVRWFEEPVHHRDHAGLRSVRGHVPPEMAVAAGEYGFTLDDARMLLASGCVDVLQADATRCGITGFMRTAILCQAYRIPLSAHCAPSVHLHPCLAAAPVVHMEWFHDHVRLEAMLLDGVVKDRHGKLSADGGRPGHGLGLNTSKAEKFKLA
jgi:L-alanine-DL-glutamate epimerase-like enolase superfamily enzyme